MTHSIGKAIKDFTQLSNPGNPDREKLAASDQLVNMVTGVNSNLYALQSCLDCVRQYFLAKMKKVMVTDKSKPAAGGKAGTKNNVRRFVEPLFPDMTLPKQDQVGFLLPLTCGHNRYPNSRESDLFT